MASAAGEIGKIDPGLCGSCVHARRMQSSRGSTFMLCNLSFTDPHFPKYPRLPVLECDGYRAKADEEAASP
jgi:hypothetical protein